MVDMGEYLSPTSVGRVRGQKANVATGNCLGYHSMIFGNIKREELEFGSLSVLADWHASTPGISRIHGIIMAPYRAGIYSWKSIPLPVTYADDVSEAAIVAKKRT
jgi:hypothetical protein